MCACVCARAHSRVCVTSSPRQTNQPAKNIWPGLAWPGLGCAVLTWAAKKVPRAFGAHDALLRALGAVPEPLPAHYAGFLRELSGGQPGGSAGASPARSLNPNELAAVLRVVQLLVAAAAAGSSAATASAVARPPPPPPLLPPAGAAAGAAAAPLALALESVPVPDATSTLRPAGQLLFDDAPWLLHAATGSGGSAEAAAATAAAAADGDGDGDGGSGVSGSGGGGGGGGGGGLGTGRPRVLASALPLAHPLLSIGLCRRLGIAAVSEVRPRDRPTDRPTDRAGPIGNISQTAPDPGRSRLGSACQASRGRASRTNHCCRAMPRSS